MARRSGALIISGIAALTALGVTAPGSAAITPAVAVQSQTVAPSSTLAVITTISVAGFGTGVAVDSDDDTVYVTSGTFPGMLSVINGRTATVTATRNVGGNYAQGVAVNSLDDTVYVANNFSNSLSVINGHNLDDSIQVTGLSGPVAVAVNQEDDTVYVTNTGSTSLSVINGRNVDDSTRVTVGLAPGSVAVNQEDDTVYVTRSNSPGDVSVINARTNGILSTILTGTTSSGVAVNNIDDTIYVVDSFWGNVAVVNGKTNQEILPRITAGRGPRSMAVDQADGSAYVGNEGSATVSVIAGPNMDDSIRVGGMPRAVAVDDSGPNAGLLYVTDLGSDNLSVIGRVIPSLGSSSGSAGGSLTINVDVPQAAYSVDDSTVASVAFGSAPATNLTAGSGDTWTVTVPAGSGTVPVTVTFRGGLSATAGNFTYSAAPSPTPPAPIPPSAPGNVGATAGDASATVTWTAPTSPGSYPVTTYQVTSSPGGLTCLTSTLTCTVTGLTNGTAYTFSVKALSGAGWGEMSAPSNAVTPEGAPKPSITITGTRAGERITITGTSTQLAGQTLTPWIKFPGETTFSQGSAIVPIAADGTFTWSRKTGKKIYVYVAHDTTKSNTVTITAR